MSGTRSMTVEEAEEAEENELLAETADDEPADSTVLEDIDETTEDLMTDMKLDDELDEVRATEPDFYWKYHIEIYPWNAEDMTENFVRLLKLAEFSQVYMRKKGTYKENGEPESLDDKLHDRQRKGSIHFYTDNFLNAKNIIRSSTWKAMAAKNLTFEITKRGPGNGSVESAYLEVDTYIACKCRFRDRPKGEFKDRTARVSHIPGTISREFLDVIFCRSYAVTGGSTVRDYHKERDGKLQQKLSEIEDFDGSLDFDCLSRGSCRAFVTAHKNVYIEGQRISIEANNVETMVAPPATDNTGVVTKQELAELTQQLHAMVETSQVAPRQRLSLKDQAASMGCTRGRGPTRVMVLPQRPINANVTRPGPGVPVPMTGRQKMNEKLRRNNQGQQMAGVPVSYNSQGNNGGSSSMRGAMAASIGETFKQEIASLQNQLQQSTAELQEKIARLQESTRSAAFLQPEPSDWDDAGYSEEDDYYEDELYSSGNMSHMKLADLPLNTPQAMMAIGSNTIAMPSMETTALSMDGRLFSGQQLTQNPPGHIPHSGALGPSMQSAGGFMMEQIPQPFPGQRFQNSPSGQWLASGQMLPQSATSHHLPQQTFLAGQLVQGMQHGEQQMSHQTMSGQSLQQPLSFPPRSYSNPGQPMSGPILHGLPGGQPVPSAMLDQMSLTPQLPQSSTTAAGQRFMPPIGHRHQPGAAQFVGGRGQIRPQRGGGHPRGRSKPRGGSGTSGSGHGWRRDESGVR